MDNQLLLNLLNLYATYIEKCTIRSKTINAMRHEIKGYIIPPFSFIPQKFELICLHLSLDADKEAANEKFLIDTIFPLIATQAPHQLFLFSQDAIANVSKCSLLLEKKISDKFIEESFNEVTESNKDLIKDKVKFLMKYFQDIILSFLFERELSKMKVFLSTLPTGVHFFTFDASKIGHNLPWHKIENIELQTQISTVSSGSDYVNEDFASLVISRNILQNQLPLHPPGSLLISQGELSAPASSPMPPQHQPLGVTLWGSPFSTVGSGSNHINGDLASSVIPRNIPQNQLPLHPPGSLLISQGELSAPASSPMPPQYQPLGVALWGNPSSTVGSGSNHINGSLASSVIPRNIPQNQLPLHPPGSLLISHEPQTTLLMPQHELPESEPASSPMPPQHQLLNVATQGSPLNQETITVNFSVKDITPDHLNVDSPAYNRIYNLGPPSMKGSCLGPSPIRWVRKNGGIEMDRRKIEIKHLAPIKDLMNHCYFLPTLVTIEYEVGYIILIKKSNHDRWKALDETIVLTYNNPELNAKVTTALDFKLSIIKLPLPNNIKDIKILSLTLEPNSTSTFECTYAYYNDTTKQHVTSIFRLNFS